MRKLSEFNSKEDMVDDVLILERSESGVPIIVKDTDLSNDIHDPPISYFPKVIGDPVSPSQISELSLKGKDSNAKTYIMKLFFQLLMKGTTFDIIITSHDQSRDGSPRVRSSGHLNGMATDVIFCNKTSDGSVHGLVDLLNSHALIATLAKMGLAFSNAIDETGIFSDMRPLIVGVEYDHIHIEWPWSDRDIPKILGPLVVRRPMNKFIIGLFFQPQEIYDLPDIRGGYEGHVLELLV